MELQEKQVEIDLMGLLNYLKKRLVIIMAVALVFGVVGLLYSTMCTTPKYIAETRLYVLNRTSNMGPQGSDYQVSTYMLQDYQVLITGKNVTKEVIKQLNLNMSPEALNSKISVTAPEDTRVLQINVVDTDPQKAADIANKVCEVAIQELKRLTDADAVHRVYEADVPVRSVGVNVKKTVIMAVLAGLAAAVAVYTVLFMLDDSIRTEEDVERYLGLSVLGVIPESKDLGDARGERRMVIVREGRR